DLSPDGGSIVYRNTLLSVDDMSERKLVNGLDGDLSPLFSRDGRSVFLIARDEGLWRAGIDDRKPVLIQPGVGPALLQGVTRDGLLYIGRQLGTGNVFRVTFDAANGKITSEPEAIGQTEPQSGLAVVSEHFEARGKELWRTGGDAPVAVFPRDITA